MAIPEDVFGQLGAGIPSLLGAEAARMISISALALYLYDWLVTLDMEIEYFWRGSWSLERLLFFMNRYMVPLLLLHVVVLFSVPDPPLTACRHGIQTGFFLNIVALTIIQMMLVTRVWYLFKGNRKVQVATVICFLVAFALSFYFAQDLAEHLVIIPSPNFDIRLAGCRAVRPHQYWRILMPSLALHTIIYVLTATSAWRHRRLFERAPLLKRLLRDGGIFYLVVLVSVIFTSVCSFLHQYPRINIPSIFSSYHVAIMSIALSRVMLNIHSFSSRHLDNLSSSTPWMLSFNELSRVRWRPGTTKGEIVVRGSGFEDDSPEYELHDSSVFDGFKSQSGSISTLESFQWSGIHVDVEMAKSSHW